MTPPPQLLLASFQAETTGGGGGGPSRGSSGTSHPFSSLFCSFILYTASSCLIFCHLQDDSAFRIPASQLTALPMIPIPSVG